MNKNNRQHPITERTVPYWKRAHKDWRFRVGVAVMLVAIALYVLSGDLACGFASDIHCRYPAPLPQR